MKNAESTMAVFYNCLVEENNLFAETLISL